MGSYGKVAKSTVSNVILRASCLTCFQNNELSVNKVKLFRFYIPIVIRIYLFIYICVWNYFYSYTIVYCKDIILYLCLRNKINTNCFKMKQKFNKVVPFLSFDLYVETSRQEQAGLKTKRRERSRDSARIFRMQRNRDAQIRMNYELFYDSLHSAALYQRFTQSFTLKINAFLGSFYIFSQMIIKITMRKML